MTELQVIISAIDDLYARRHVRTLKNTHCTPANQLPANKGSEMCVNLSKGECRFGRYCIFAHAFQKLQPRVFKASTFKVNFHKESEHPCGYGQRCQYLHDEVCWMVGPYKVLRSGKGNRAVWTIIKAQDHVNVIVLKMYNWADGIDSSFDAFKSILNRIERLETSNPRSRPAICQRASKNGRKRKSRAKKQANRSAQKNTESKNAAPGSKKAALETQMRIKKPFTKTICRPTAIRPLRSDEEVSGVVDDVSQLTINARPINSMDQKKIRLNANMKNLQELSLYPGPNHEDFNTGTVVGKVPTNVISENETISSESEISETTQMASQMVQLRNLFHPEVNEKPNAPSHPKLSPTEVLSPTHVQTPSPVLSPSPVQFSNSMLHSGPTPQENVERLLSPSPEHLIPMFSPPPDFINFFPPPLDLNLTPFNMRHPCIALSPTPPSFFPFLIPPHQGFQNIAPIPSAVPPIFDLPRGSTPYLDDEAEKMKEREYGYAGDIEKMKERKYGYSGKPLMTYDERGHYANFGSPKEEEWRDIDTRSQFFDAFNGVAKQSIQYHDFLKCGLIEDSQLI